jgi:uncharacterized protein (DUF885 family)
MNKQGLMTPKIRRDRQRVIRAAGLLRMAEAGLVGMGINQTTNRVVDAIQKAYALLPKVYAKERAALEWGMDALRKSGNFRKLLQSVRYALYRIESDKMTTKQSFQQRLSGRNDAVDFEKRLRRASDYMLANRGVHEAGGYARVLVADARRAFPAVLEPLQKIHQALVRIAQRNALGDNARLSNAEASALARRYQQVAHLVRNAYTGKAASPDGVKALPGGDSITAIRQAMRYVLKMKYADIGRLTGNPSLATLSASILAPYGSKRTPWEKRSPAAQQQAVAMARRIVAEKMPNYQTSPRLKDVLDNKRLR